MKKLIILGALLLPMISSAQNTTETSDTVSKTAVRADQLVEKEGLYFLADSEVPYSGFIRERYPSGLTKMEINVVDGIADSAVSEWYANSEQKGDEAQNMPPSNITVSLLAGEGREKGGADGIGVEARFWDLRGAAADGRGFLYVVDGNRLRVISPDGAVRTLAGKGQPGYVDGKGFAAKFCNPRGITIDASGNLYIADTGNNKIRKVTSDGNVSTYAGEAYIFAGRPARSDGRCLGKFTNSEHLYLEKRRAMTLDGIAIDAHDNVFVADVTNKEIYKITPNGEASLFASHSFWGNFKDGQGTAARFSNPVAIKIDSENNLYVADQGNRRLRKISPDGAVSTLAGSSTYSDRRVRQINTGKWIGRNEGPGVDVQFSRADNVGVDESGNVYVATDAGIQKITPDGQVSIFKERADGFADGPLAEAKFSRPSDFAFDSDGNVLIADHDFSKIRKITPSGTVSTVAGSVDEKGSWRGTADGPVLTAQLYFPTRLAVDGFGNVFVTQRSSNQIRKITPDGIVSSIGGRESCTLDGNAADGQFCSPSGIAADASGNIYVADSGNAKIKKITAEGVVSTLAGTTRGYADGPVASAKFNAPKGVTVDSDGNVFVADSGNDNIRRISVDGIVSTIAGSSVLLEPRAPLWGFALAVDASGNVYSANGSVYRQITRITPDGEEVTNFAGAISEHGYADGERSAARFRNPTGLSFDSKGNLYVADSDKRGGTVRKVTPDGTVSTVNGAHRSEWMGRPKSVAVGVDGTIYVLDKPNHRIVKVVVTQQQ